MVVVVLSICIVRVWCSWPREQPSVFFCVYESFDVRAFDSIGRWWWLGDNMYFIAFRALPIYIYIYVGSLPCYRISISSKTLTFRAVFYPRTCVDQVVEIVRILRWKCVNAVLLLVPAHMADGCFHVLMCDWKTYTHTHIFNHYALAFGPAEDLAMRRWRQKRRRRRVKLCPASGHRWSENNENSRRFCCRRRSKGTGVKGSQQFVTHMKTYMYIEHIYVVHLSRNAQLSV